MEAVFYKHDNYATLWNKFSDVWSNMQLELHHLGARLDKEGWDELDADAIFSDLSAPNEPLFTLTDETIVETAMDLFSDYCGCKAYILRDGISVENKESLAYCNNPFRLLLNKYTYSEFKRRFTERWSNLSIELYETIPQKGGLLLNLKDLTGEKELADNFDMKNLKHTEKAYLHDYLFVSDWANQLVYVRIAAAIINIKLGIYCDKNMIYERIKTLQEMEKV